jgi:hypothetical protein
MNAAAKPAQTKPAQTKPAQTKPAQADPAVQPDEPAKGGTRQPHETAYPSGDTPKPHGDKLADAVEKAAERTKTK